jgi:hypothetical protein
VPFETVRRDTTLADVNPLGVVVAATMTKSQLLRKPEGVSWTRLVAFVMAHRVPQRLEPRLLRGVNPWVAMLCALRHRFVIDVPCYRHGGMLVSVNVMIPTPKREQELILHSLHLPRTLPTLENSSELLPILRKAMITFRSLRILQ